MTLYQFIYLLTYTYLHVLVTEFRGMAQNGLFCADDLRPLDVSPSLTLPTNRLSPSLYTHSQQWRNHLTTYVKGNGYGEHFTRL